tara:strand:+ start:363 stop:1640 length:1278 start_codon:yes stop_codon:yes gene_type:complete
MRFKRTKIISNLKKTYSLIKEKSLIKKVPSLIKENDVVKKFASLTKENYVVKKFASLTNRNDLELYLKQDKFLLKTTNWVMVGLTFFGLGWLCIAKTDEIIIVSGKIIPTGEVSPIKMPSTGIIKEILVEEGNIVAKEQILLKLDTRSNIQRDKTLKEEITFKENQLSSLTEEFEDFIKNTRIGFISLNNNIDLQNSILEKYENLLIVGAVPELQYLDRKSNLISLNTEKDNLIKDFESNKSKYIQKIDVLNSELVDLKGRLAENKLLLINKIVKSPIAGTIFDLKPKNIDYSAQATETILKIVPYGDLEARLEVPSSDIGFVKEGMTVDINIDSYPASDFGVVNATITSIGSDALKPDSSENRQFFAFPVNASLSDQFLEVKKGRKLKLKVGMTLSANIKLRKVSYLQLLLTTFKEKAESIQEL